MSSKWRAIQHRHRYTYNTVVFPSTYTDSVNSLPPQIATSKFFSLLKELVSLNSTYAQLNHTKGLAAVLLGALFLENSLPLHKTLVSVLVKARTFQALIRRCYRKLCEDYGGGRGKRFCVSRSEPEGAPKKLLPRALRWLMDVANASFVGPVETNNSNGDIGKLPSVKSDKVFKSVVSSDIDISDKVSKIRDEGVIPVVHAFNVLRAAFNDTNLAADTSGFSAEAMIVSVRSFSSPHWVIVSVFKAVNGFLPMDSLVYCFSC